MDDFAQQPTLEKLDRCTKADLLLVAGLFDIVVPLNARKAEIKTILSEKLVEKGVIVTAKPETGSAAESPDGAVGAEAATATQASSGQGKAETEVPALASASSADPLALLQAGVAAGDLKLAL